MCLYHEQGVCYGIHADQSLIIPLIILFWMKINVSLRYRMLVLLLIMHDDFTWLFGTFPLCVTFWLCFWLASLILCLEGMMTIRLPGDRFSKTKIATIIYPTKKVNYLTTQTLFRTTTLLYRIRLYYVVTKAHNKAEMRHVIHLKVINSCIIRSRTNIRYRSETLIFIQNKIIKGIMSDWSCNNTHLVHDKGT